MLTTMIKAGNWSYFVNLGVLNPNLPYAKFYLTSGDLHRSMNFVTKIAQTVPKFTVSSGIKCIKNYDQVGNQVILSILV